MALPSCRAAAAAILATAVAAFPVSTPAQDGSGARQIVGLSGFEMGSASSYGYVGAITPLSGRFTGNDWILRLWVDHLTYETDDAFGTLNVRQPGGNIGISRGFPFWDGSASVGAGIVLGYRTYARDTDQDDDGWQVRFRVQGEYFGSPEEHRHLNLLWSFTLPEPEGFLRAEYLFGFDGFRIGPSVTAQAGQDFESLRLGATIQEIALSDTIRIGASAGWEIASRESGPYAGLNLTVLFGFD